MRKSSRVKRRPERWTIHRKLPVRVPIPEEVEESDDEDIAALAGDFVDMSLSDESASEDDYMSEDAEEDEVEEEEEARKKSREERLDEEYDDVDDDPDYKDMSDTDSVAPPAPSSSASSSSSSSSSLSRSQSRKRKPSKPLESGKQKRKKPSLGPKPQRDRSNLRAAHEYSVRGKNSDVKDPETWEDYHDLFLPPPSDLKPTLHVFGDDDPQTEFPKKDSDVSGELRSKLEFVRLNKKP